MKQKFTFEIDPDKGLLTLTEAAETDPGTFLVVHGETYSLEGMKTAAKQGQEPFIEALRRRNLFPPLDLAQKIHELLPDFLEGKSTEPLVIDYEDIQYTPSLETLEEEEEEEEIPVDVDGLLDSTVEDLSDDDIKEIDSDDDDLGFKPEDVSEHEN